MQVGAVLLALTGAFQNYSAAQDGTHLKARGAADRKIILDVIAAQVRLSASDVIVSDNGLRLTSKDFQLLSPHDAGSQSQVIFVIDALNSSFQEVTRSEEAIEQYLKGCKGELARPTSIVVLSDTPPEGTSESRAKSKDTMALHPRQLFAHRIPATQDGTLLIRALETYKVGLHRILESQAGTGQSERVQLSLQALSFLANAEKTQTGPKIVVWISPGWPFLANSDAKSNEQVFDSVIYFSDLLRSARMILYAVDPQGITRQDNSAETEAFLLSSRSSSIRANGHAPNVPVELSDSYYKNFLKGARNANESNPNDLALQVLAYQSGGLVLQHNNDLRAQVARCASEADRVLSVEYTPTGSGVADVYHAIVVEFNGGSQPLRTRTGFYFR